MGSMYKQGMSSNLENLREDISSLADELKSVLSDNGQQITSSVNQRVEKIREDIDDVISEGAWSAGRELMRDWGVNDFGTTIQNTVRERPFTALAIAAGLGAVVASQLRR